MAFRSSHHSQDKKQDKKTFPVRVASMDAELEFRLEKNATGQDLFDLVCRTTGLRETWYFGLQYMDSRGFITWLKMNKPVRNQDVPKQEVMQFMLLVQFFPEEANEELIQDITIRLFFLQVKESILRMHVFCPAEIATLLASYACQAQYGDLDESLYRPGMLNVEEVLPKQIVTQFQITNDMWEDRIRNYYAGHKALLREEAELQYLGWAQNLDMYGVNYFQIYNMRKSELWLGVTAFGLNVYDKDNRLTPKISFAWSEIRNISFEGKRFIIKPIDRRAPNFVFYSPKLRANKIILDLCMGNHDLYVRRRQPDTMELQQMKAQSKEVRIRRDADRNKLLHEKQMKQTLQREKEELERRLMQYQEEIRMANEALRRSEQSAELLADKSRLAEYEVAILQQKAGDAEKQVDRIRASVDKSEEEKATIEKKLYEAERNASCMAEEAEQRNQELHELRNGLASARYAEKSARDKLIEITTNLPPMTTPRPPNLVNNNSYAVATPSRVHPSVRPDSANQTLYTEKNFFPATTGSNGFFIETGGSHAITLSPTASSTGGATSPESTKNQQYYFGGENNNNFLEQGVPVVRSSSHFPTPSSSSTVYATTALYPSASFSVNSVTKTNEVLVGRSAENVISSHSAQNSPSSLSKYHGTAPSVPAAAVAVNKIENNRPAQLRNQYVKYTFIEPTTSVGGNSYVGNSVPAANGSNNNNRLLITSSQQQLPTYEQHIMLNNNTGNSNQNSSHSPTAAANVMMPAMTTGGSSVTASSHSGGGINEDDEIEELARQIESEQRHMMEKSKNLQRQLIDMRREFDGLRLDEQITSLDRIHLERKGETKHSTLQKATSGATARRVAFFDKL